MPGSPTHALAAAIALGALLAASPLCAQTPAAKVDGAFIRQNEAATKDWPTIGLDYAETRFSKLDKINESNVKGLGLVWSYNLESTRGVEAPSTVHVLAGFRLALGSRARSSCCPRSSSA